MIITDEENELITHPGDHNQSAYIEAIVKDVFNRKEDDKTFSRKTDGIERYY